MAGPGRVDAGVVVVAVLVVLAGCNGVVQSGTSEDTPRETLTPAPVATPPETATPRPATFDWLVDGERVRMDRLLDRHTGYLSERSFVLRTTRSTAGGDGSVGTFDRRVVVANGSTYSRRVAGSRTNGVEVTYVDPGGIYRRVEAPNGSTRVTAEDGRAASARARFALLVGSNADLLLATDEPRHTTVERQGTRYLQLFSTRAPEYLAAVYGGYNVTDFSVTVWVHPAGYIRTVVAEFTLVDGADRVEVTERRAYRDVGATTLDRPEWVRALEAPNERPPGTPTSEFDGEPDAFWNGTETPRGS